MLIETLGGPSLFGKGVRSPGCRASTPLTKQMSKWWIHVDAEDETVSEEN